MEIQPLPGSFSNEMSERPRERCPFCWGHRDTGQVMAFNYGLHTPQVRGPTPWLSPKPGGPAEPRSPPLGAQQGQVWGARLLPNYCRQQRMSAGGVFLSLLASAAVWAGGCREVGGDIYVAALTKIRLRGLSVKHTERYFAQPERTEGKGRR